MLAKTISLIHLDKPRVAAEDVVGSWFHMWMLSDFRGDFAASLAWAGVIPFPENGCFAPEADIAAAAKLSILRCS